MEEVKKKLVDFVTSDTKCFYLFGAAGTGKTTLIVNALSKIPNIEIKFTAPTHKAVNVLSEKLANRTDFVYETLTIHSLLKCKLKIDDSGNRSFKSLNQKYDKIFTEKYKIVVVDECSMINQDLNCQIESFSYKADCKIIFVGDPYQLPPVNEKENSQVFIDALNSKVYSVLKINFRNDNTVTSIFREYVKSGKYETIKKYIDTNYSHKKYVNEKNNNKIILCWTNKMVNLTNKNIRKLLWEDASKRFNIGEKLICINTFNIQGECINSGFQIDVKKIEIKTEEYKYYLINELYTIVHEDSLEKFEKDMFQMKINCRNKKLWEMYYKKMDFNNPFDYGYCTTVHKSQGSGFDSVFVNIKDIMLNKNKLEMKKCLYTAVSRYIKNITIFEE